MSTPIQGYRQLSEAEIALINRVKEHAEETRQLVHAVEQALLQQERTPLPEGHAPNSVVTSPMRWLAEGRTDLQKGFMCVVRAISQPTTF